MRTITWRQWRRDPPPMNAHIVLATVGPSGQVFVDQDIVANAHWQASDAVYWCYPQDIYRSLPSAHDLIEEDMAALARAQGA